MQPVSKRTELDASGNIVTRKCYGPVYVPFKEDGQNILMPHMADMSRKVNLKLLYNMQLLGTCTNEEYKYLKNTHFDTDTFQYSHKATTLQIMVQGVYIGNRSPLVANIKTQPYSIIQYADGIITGLYFNTHEIPIFVDNGSTLNIMPTYFYEKAYYLHHFSKEREAQTIHAGNRDVTTHFWIDIPVNIHGCMLQLKLLVCDTQAKARILLNKMALEQLQTWQDYSSNTIYVKETALPMHAVQDIELLPNRKMVVELIEDCSAQNSKLIQGIGIVWVWSNDSSKPLQPITATFHNDKTLVSFHNTTGVTQYISKGALVGILDMRSKDRGMTNFEWKIPTDEEGNLVLYGHTFASSLEPTKLSNEDPLLQVETKFDVLDSPQLSVTL